MRDYRSDQGCVACARKGPYLYIDKLPAGVSQYRRLDTCVAELDVSATMENLYRRETDMFLRYKYVLEVA